MCSSGFVRLLKIDEDVFVSYCLVSDKKIQEFDFVHGTCPKKSVLVDPIANVLCCIQNVIEKTLLMSELNIHSLFSLTRLLTPLATMTSRLLT